MICSTCTAHILRGFIRSTATNVLRPLPLSLQRYPRRLAFAHQLRRESTLTSEYQTTAVNDDYYIPWAGNQSIETGTPKMADVEGMGRDHQPPPAPTPVPEVLEENSSAEPEIIVKPEIVAGSEAAEGGPKKLSKNAKRKAARAAAAAAAVEAEAEAEARRKEERKQSMIEKKENKERRKEWGGWDLPPIEPLTPPTESLEKLRHFVESTPRSKIDRWRLEKAAIKEKLGYQPWNPLKKLSPEAILGVRALHAERPEEYNTETLSQLFEVSPESIRRILKSTWAPTEKEMEDRMARWMTRGSKIMDMKLERGEIKTKATRKKEQKARQRKEKMTPSVLMNSPRSWVRRIV